MIMVTKCEVRPVSNAPTLIPLAPALCFSALKARVVAGSASLASYFKEVLWEIQTAAMKSNKNDSN